MIKNKVFYDFLRENLRILHTFLLKNGQVGGNVNPARLPSEDKRRVSLCPLKVGLSYTPNLPIYIIEQDYAALYGNGWQ